MSSAKVRATVHVTPSSGDGSARPDPARVQRAAESLRDLGFDILRAGRFGVSVQADWGRFQVELGIDPGQEARSGIAIAPRDASLTELIDYVDIVPPATPGSE